MLNIVNNCSSLLFEFVKQFVGGRTTGSVSNFIGSTFSHSREKISQLWKTQQKCELFPETMSFHTLRFHIFWKASIFSWFSPENCWPKSTILSTVCVNPTGQFTTNKLDISKEFILQLKFQIIAQIFVSLHYPIYNILYIHPFLRWVYNYHFP